ncbi:MAG: methionine--tRNA ligase [Alphaproteobacteria bacterium]|nr:methionine--tRNA ligase [Alphaproteobacteria bacterium]
MSRILITSALPYVNGVKHLGNLAGSMLPADVFARFCRACGHETLAICATDEHGTPAELAAAEAGEEVAAFCARWHERQRELGEAFGLSWDHFGRTSSPQNHAFTQHLADRLDANGYIEERTIRQVYSLEDERFLPDRYVVGTCPHCGYDRARGDQCENCTRVLDPTDLLEPRSAISGLTRLEVRESRHLYLLQSKLVDRLRQWIGSQTEWPHLVTSIALKWLDEGLQDRGITRDLKWGVPVAHDGKWEGLAGKVFYVWFDAPIGYIGATKEWADLDPKARDWERWWRLGKGADAVRYVQFMGKDNVPFHTVGFPATLLGSGEDWKLVDVIKGVNWLTYYGGKFSTSQRRGVFMDQALEVLPADYWRYYLTANAPEGSDSSFTWEHFAATVNKDLADVLGNFVNRLLKFSTARFGETVPAGGAPGPEEAALLPALAARMAAYKGHLEAIELRKAMGELRAIWVLGNEYLARAAPWVAIKTDPERAAIIIRTGINLARLMALLSWPVIPGTAERILAAVDPALADRAGGIVRWPSGSIEDEMSRLGPGAPIAVPGLLFRKLDPEEVAALEARFGGADAAPAPGK